MSTFSTLGNQVNTDDETEVTSSQSYNGSGVVDDVTEVTSLVSSVKPDINNDYIASETRTANDSKIKYINGNQASQKTKQQKIVSPLGDIDASDFPSSGNDINVGTYSGSVVGSVPIFSSYYRMPFSAYEKNRKALMDYKYAALEGNTPPQLEEISTDPNYDEEFRNQYVNSATELYNQYTPSDLKDPRTEGGKAWMLLNQNYKAKAGKISNVVKMADDILKSEENQYIPLESKEAAYRIKMGLAHPFSTDKDLQSLNNDMNLLAKGKSMGSMLKQVIPKIQRKALEEYFNGGTFTDKEALEAMHDDKYANIYASKLTSYYDENMSQELAMSVAADNPSSVYVNEVWNGQLDANGKKIMIKNPQARSKLQFFDNKELGDYIHRMVGAEQEKTNFLTVSKANPSTRVVVNNAQPDKKTGDYDWTSKTMTELGANGSVSIGTSNVYSGDQGAVMIDKNGKMRIASWQDPLGMATAIHGVASGQQNIVDQNEAIFSANTYDASLPYGGQFKSGATGKQSSVTDPLSSQVPTSNKNKVDYLVKAVGVVPITQNINIKGFSGNDKTFSLNLNTKDKEESQFTETEGVIVPAAMVTNPSDKITYISDGKYVVYPNARYVDAGNGSYGIQTNNNGKWEDLQPFKEGSHTLQVPKTIVDNILTGKYKEVAAVINKNYSTQQTVKAADPLNSSTGTKTEGVTDYKKIGFENYDAMANSFTTLRNGKKNLPRSYGMMLTGFMKVMKDYPISKFSDKNEFAQKFNDWKKTLTEEDYRNLLNSPPADNDALYKFVTGK